MYASARSHGNGGNPRRCFERALNQWLPIRNESIRKLEKLLESAQSNEAAYDKIQLQCKYGSSFCKKEKLKASTDTLEELAASLGSMFCDIASGATSVAQMIDTDAIQTSFQEIMDEDATATKKMYEARSRYVAEYRYTEEIIRKFGGTTVGETLEKISESLGIKEFFERMEKAKYNGEDTTLTALTALGSIVDRSFNRDVGREVVDAVEELVDSNPACVGTVAGVGKSLYGATDLGMMSVKKSKKSGEGSGVVAKAASRAVDGALLRQDHSDIRDLEYKIKCGSQSSLGKRVQEALELFINEKKDMLKLLNEL